MRLVLRMNKVNRRIRDPITIRIITRRRSPVGALLKRVSETQPVTDLVHGGLSAVERRKGIVFERAALERADTHIRRGIRAALNQISLWDCSLQRGTAKLTPATPAPRSVDVQALRVSRSPWRVKSPSAVPLKRGSDWLACSAP